MITKYSAIGNFDDFLPHELLVDLLKAGHSGSVEIRFAEGSRTLRFSRGKITGASSTFHSEQIDKIIEREISSSLTDEQREALLELAKQGHKYSKAVIEAGVLNSADLLKFNDQQARLICENVLSDSAQRYDMREEATTQMRPLEVDLLEKVYRSLINDVSADVIADQLGADEQTVFMPSEKKSVTSMAVQQNEELATVLRHLDGKRTVKELRGKVGFNPERTARILLFLKMIDWIEPVISGPEDFIENPMEIAASTTGSYSARAEAGQLDEEASDPLLKAVEGQDDSVDIERDTMRSAGSGDIQTDADSTLNKPEDFNAILSAHQQENSGWFKTVITHPATIAAAVLLLLAGALAVFWPKLSGANNTEDQLAAAEVETSKDPLVTEEPEDLSFYDESIDTDQLPIDEDFTRDRPNPDTPVKIPVDTEGSAESSAITEKQPQGSENEKQPPPGPAKNTDQPDSNEPKAPVDLELAAAPPLADVQSSALEQVLLGSWGKASSLWRLSLLRHHADDFTLVFNRLSLPSQDQVAFEQFVNNATMRPGLAILQRPGGRLIFIWGVFGTITEAEQAIRDLPSRFRGYDPSIQKVKTVAGS